MTDSLVNDLVASWSEAELGVPGRVLPVVRAPARGARRPSARRWTRWRPVDRAAGRRPGRDDADEPPAAWASPPPRWESAASVFCVDVSRHPKTKHHHGTFVLCNAEVVEATRNEKAREGCLSVPDLTGDVKRATRLVVQGRLPGTGREVRVTANAFEARALQHEIDHCDGLLFLDRVAGAHAIHPRKTYL